ncbi:hypothetical protein CRG98_001521 [Punica granatum]|uniref:Beta-amyrin 28-oxidase-like n=1 Tax=Punica granatum TaxID=22663 RepID=A0A2I0LBN5_PUNGR|nr:hypothetical protein CRG98_001521 [Punica granatum]
MRSKRLDELLNWEGIQKMRYSWMVACEALRLAPPVQGTFREAITDFAYSGFTIPKGWKTHWTPHSTHKDPKYFLDPEKFDPSRFEGSGPAPYTFVPLLFRLEKAIPDEKIIYNPNLVPASGLPICIEPRI